MKRFVVPIALLTIWEISSRFFNFFFFPTASSAFKTLFDVLLSGELFGDTLVSVMRLVVSSSLAIPIAICLGIGIAISDKINEMVMPTVNAIRVVPASALLPIIILVFGLNEISTILLLSFVCFIPVLLATIDGVRQQYQQYSPLINNLDLSLLDAIKKVFIPGAMPSILTGIDIGVPAVFKFLIIAEAFGATAGIGYRLSESADYLQYSKAYALLLWTGAIGILVSFVLSSAKSRLLRWM